MQRFKNILLIYDGKNGGIAALNRAAILAKRNKAQLSVVDVMEELPRDLKITIPSMPDLDLQEFIITERIKQIEHFISPSQKEGIRINVRVLQGTEFIEIIREVLRNKHDLVMKTAKGKGGLKDVLFGSTAMHLMRKCPCPVWVIKPTHRKKYARIMAAVNLDPSDEVKTSLNTKIMELATSLARFEGSELHIVHTWTLYSELTLAASEEVSKRELARHLNETRKMHKGWLNELIEKYASETPKDRIHLMKGDAEILIPVLAKRKRIELIVMGTVCRTGISGFFIGNTAEKVLHEVDCSVLTIKPEGFVSPVKVKER